MIKISHIKPYIVLKKNFNPRYFRGFFRLKSLFISAAMILSLLTFVGCNEYDDTIGLDLIDNPLQFNSTDTISIVALTQLEDSLVTSDLNFHLMGYISDPVFGKTKASIYTEALPIIIPPIFADISPDSLVIDSVVLGLRYGGYAGDISIQQHVRLYELAEIIPFDSIYSSKTLQTKREIHINNPSFYPRPSETDTVFFYGADTTVAPPHLRLNIDPEFGRRFITAMDSLRVNDATFSDAEEFRKYLSGFLITVDETEDPGAMLYFRLTDSYSRLQIYYKKTGQENNNTYELPLGNATGRRFNHFEHFDHADASADIRAQIFEGDTALGDSILFVQSMANYRVMLKLPYINDLIDEQNEEFAINSAQLIIPIDQSFSLDSVDLAQALILYRENPSNPGQLISLNDQFVAPGYFGGTINTEKSEFAFNITQHLQMILEDPSKNTPLYIRVSGAAQNAGRVVLKGPGRSDPIRLVIKYTQPVTN